MPADVARQSDVHRRFHICAIARYIPYFLVSAFLIPNVGSAQSIRCDGDWFRGNLHLQNLTGCSLEEQIVKSGGFSKTRKLHLQATAGVFSYGEPSRTIIEGTIPPAQEALQRTVSITATEQTNESDGLGELTIEKGDLSLSLLPKSLPLNPNYGGKVELGRNTIVKITNATPIHISYDKNEKQLAVDGELNVRVNRNVKLLGTDVEIRGCEGSLSLDWVSTGPNAVDLSISMNSGDIRLVGGAFQADLGSQLGSNPRTVVCERAAGIVTWQKGQLLLRAALDSVNIQVSNIRLSGLFAQHFSGQPR